MKNFILIILLQVSNLVTGQIVIKEINSYSDLNGTKLVGLLSNNSIWTSNGQDTWTQVATDEQPLNTTIKLLGCKSNLNTNNKSTDLVVVLDDNSIWNLENGISKWTKIQMEGLPINTKIKEFKTYIKYNGMYDLDTRLVLILDDNTIWWSDGERVWEKINTTGLPQELPINSFSTYQKVAMFGTETRFLVTLSDNSFWWYASGNDTWEKVITNNYPDKKNILKSDAYMKTSLGSAEGRVISVFDDNSIMWMATGDKVWTLLNTTELPKQAIKKINIYSKLNLLGKGTRVILLLENNQIWGWLAENKTWSKINTAGLPN